MKFRNKLQFFSLLLASIICGQELTHTVFHYHADFLTSQNQYQASGILQLENPVRRYFTSHIHIKAVCPLCNSGGGKSVPEIIAEPEFISHAASSRPHRHEVFTFTFFMQTLSRGPPVLNSFA
ncbi:MAG: hypothetical protein WCS27_16955 [Victivallaceae bacterium]